ncbi:hypothetical protein ACQP0C_42045 (plasmid) [Nocardia sp. CA-129566]|uniref:hypothetical protein n=1 Tax=Nocardia sp. CA-129566 TaxID=3239976 RepID=UPI003D95BF88
MSTRKSRGNKPYKKQQIRRYRPPLGLEYNEFVGELGPTNGDTAAELYVRYGVRNDQYVDWSIELNARQGNLVDYLASGRPLPRRPMARVQVADSEIRHVTFDPRDPRRRPVVEKVIPLQAGDDGVVDEHYSRYMASLERAWTADHGEDPHTTATFGFANWNRDPDFRNNRYPWLHNTLVALDSDVAEEIVIERGGAYFNEKDRTAAVWMPAIERMKFFKANQGETPNDHEPDEESTQRQPALQSTMGMIAAVVNRSEDWLDDFLREQGSD